MCPALPSGLAEHWQLKQRQLPGSRSPRADHSVRRSRDGSLLQAFDEVELVEPAQVAAGISPTLSGDHGIAHPDTRWIGNAKRLPRRSPSRVYVDPAHSEGCAWPRDEHGTPVARPTDDCFVGEQLGDDPRWAAVGRESRQSLLRDPRQEVSVVRNPSGIDIFRSDRARKSAVEFLQACAPRRPEE